MKPLALLATAAGALIGNHVASRIAGKSLSDVAADAEKLATRVSETSRQVAEGASAVRTLLTEGFSAFSSMSFVDDEDDEDDEDDAPCPGCPGCKRNAPPASHEVN